MSFRNKSKLRRILLPRRSSASRRGISSEHLNAWVRSAKLPATHGKIKSRSTSEQRRSRTMCRFGTQNELFWSHRKSTSRRDTSPHVSSRGGGCPRPAVLTAISHRFLATNTYHVLLYLPTGTSRARDRCVWGLLTATARPGRLEILPSGPCSCVGVSLFLVGRC